MKRARNFNSVIQIFVLTSIDYGHRFYSGCFQVGLFHSNDYTRLKRLASQNSAHYRHHVKHNRVTINAKRVKFGILGDLSFKCNDQ